MTGMTFVFEYPINIEVKEEGRDKSANEYHSEEDGVYIEPPIEVFLPEYEDSEDDIEKNQLDVQQDGLRAEEEVEGCGGEVGVTAPIEVFIPEFEDSEEGSVEEQMDSMDVTAPILESLLTCKPGRIGEGALNSVTSTNDRTAMDVNHIGVRNKLCDMKKEVDMQQDRLRAEEEVEDCDGEVGITAPIKVFIPQFEDSEDDLVEEQMDSMDVTAPILESLLTWKTVTTEEDELSSFTSRNDGIYASSDVYHMEIETRTEPCCNVSQNTFNISSYPYIPFEGHTEERATVSEHMKVHSAEKAYFCDECKKGFTRKDKLSEHKKIHTGEKPFCCDICQKRFARKEVLSEHKKIHTGEKPFCCDICQKSFARKDKLSRHLKIHTEEKAFCCDVCKKRFTRRDALSQHLRMHMQKPFRCDVCSKCFTHRRQLAKHLTIHSRRNL